MILERRHHHNGIDFIMFESNQAHGEAALIDKKHVLTGRASVTLALHQYKYGDEAIIQIYAPLNSIITKERVATNYERIQVFFKMTDFLEICDRIKALIKS